jgi:FkbM family methyltransferase
MIIDKSSYGLRNNMIGKLQAAHSLVRFMRYFRNWREIWSAYRAGRCLPPLVFRNGLVLHHEDGGDDPISLFQEIFLAEPYTSGGFYRPSAGDIVLDLGANIGAFALYLQWRAPGVRVHCFEPAAATRERLLRNVAENGLGERITVHPYAVAGVESTAVLKQAARTAHRSMYESSFTETIGEETINCVTLDQAVAMCGDGPIDLLKVDIEGGEIEAIEAAGPETWRRVRRVAVEYHDLFRPGCRDRVKLALQTQGFDSIEIVPDAYHNGQLGIIRAKRST